MLRHRSQFYWTAWSISLPAIVWPIWRASLFLTTVTTGFGEPKRYMFDSSEDPDIVADEYTNHASEHAVWDVL